MILKVQDGRTWSVKYSFKLYNGCPKFIFNCGWKAFARDNCLKVGDVCIFVLTKSIGILFEVSILCENVVANSTALPGKHEICLLYSNITCSITFSF